MDSIRQQPKKPLITRPGWLLLSAGLLMTMPLAAEWPTLLLTPQERTAIEQQRDSFKQQAQQAKQAEQARQAAEPSTDSANQGDEAEPDKLLRVSAILLQADGTRRAMINGEMYREYEAKQGIKVHRIYANAVSLTVQEKRGRAQVGVRYSLKDWPNAPQAAITVK